MVHKMDTIFVLFIAEDLEYAHRAAECVSAEDKGIVFTVADSSQNCDFKKFDVVVCDGSKNIENAVNISGCGTAYELAEVINGAYCEKHGKKRLKPLTGSTSFIYVCGSRGGTGKTETAQGLAQELCRFHGKRVLYLNFEEFETAHSYTPQAKGKELEKYLFKCVLEKKAFSSFDDSYTAQNEYGVHYFSAGDGKNPLRDLSEAELLDFLQGIHKSRQYDFVIMDGTSALGEVEKLLLGFCHAVCQVERENCEKTAFLGFAKSILGSDIENKLLKVENFCMEKYDDESGGISANGQSLSEKRDIIRINNLQKLSMDTDFGLGMKELSQKLTLILQ